MIGIIYYLVKKNFFVVFLFLLLYLVLIANSVHNSYPDEFDNILGGYLINHGILPYKGFFSHHGPVSYYLASFLTLISGQSFVKFRLLTAIFYLLFIIISFIILKKRAKEISFSFLFVYMFLLAISSTFFWGHMFLADPISGYFIVPAYGVLFLKIFQEEKLDFSDLIIISAFSSLSVLNSITYIYAVFILLFITFAYYTKKIKIDFKSRFFLKQILKFSLIFLVPYLLFLAYLIVTFSLNDYIYQAILYNKNHYVYNYPRPPGSTSLNPIRYAIVILNNFINAYQPLLSGIKNVEFMNPFNVTLALSNLTLWIFLIFKRKYLLFALSFLLIIYVSIRGNPLNVRATDYQSAVYIMLSFINSSFIFFMLKKEVNTLRNHLARYFFSTLFIIFSAYWLYNFIFVFAELWRMTYSRYMGTMPLIYDRPQVASVVNAIVDKEDYCWIGPFEFGEIFYLKCKFPSKYNWILPQFAGIDKIKKEIITDFTKNKPDVIVYNREFCTFSATPEYNRFFTDFLDKNYFLLKDVFPDKHYHFVNGTTQDFRYDDNFNFEKSKAEKLVTELDKKGLIRSDKN